MKKFKFTLEKVLDYKEQVENGLKNEQAQILKLIETEEEALFKLEQDYKKAVTKLEKEKKDGCLAKTLYMYEGYLKSLGIKIKNQERIVEDLKEREEQKKSEIIETVKERSSLDIIKTKRKAQYDGLVRKEEELLIEEFVSNVTISQKSDHIHP